MKAAHHKNRIKRSKTIKILNKTHNINKYSIRHHLKKKLLQTKILYKQIIRYKINNLKIMKNVQKNYISMK